MTKLMIYFIYKKVNIWLYIFDGYILYKIPYKWKVKEMMMIILMNNNF